MIDAKLINLWVQNIIESLPPGLKNLPQDTKAHLQASLQQTFSNLDLVTREDFDAQVKVLQKTRLKLEQLETRLNQLEKSEKIHEEEK